ncbi:hypothetical protein ZWY2020_033748 [Hordeum vulgare]|nr:hypothetical protein ZWY2020_033748 [Hordeum vulgare]
MVGVVNHAARPEEDHVTFAATEASEAAEAAFTAHVMVVWLGMSRRQTSPEDVRDAFHQALGFNPLEMQVAAHHPEDFLVYFPNPLDHDYAVGKDFDFGGRTFKVRAWSADRHSDWPSLPFHVRICLEGLPMQLWSKELAALAISRRCALDAVKDESLRCVNTETLNFWAWAPTTDVIAKVVWITVTKPLAAASASLLPGAAP